ncbi:hypothetical protein PS2_042666 [Malus domestica]
MISHTCISSSFAFLLLLFAHVRRALTATSALFSSRTLAGVASVGLPETVLPPSAMMGRARNQEQEDGNAKNFIYVAKDEILKDAYFSEEDWKMII